jgi:two-component system, sporulation sensor kinase E
MELENNKMSGCENEIVKDIHNPLERQLYNWFITSKDGMILLDQTLMILDVNPILCQEIGKNREDLIGTLLESLVPDAQRDRGCIQNRLLNLNGYYSVEIPFLFHHRLLYYEVSIAPIEDTDFYIASLKDITERKELGHKNQRLYKELFKKALDGIVFWNDTGRIIDANQSACAIFEISYNHFIQCKLQDFVFAKDNDFFRMVNQLWGTGIIRDELLFIMANGQKKFLEFTMELHSIDGYHIAIFRDISERKHIEEQLRKSELKFRKIFESSLNGIIIWDNEKNIIDINEEGEKIIEQTKKSIVGQSFKRLIADLTLNSATLEEISEGYQKSGKVIGHIPIYMKSGEIKQIEYSVKYDGFTGQNISTFRDVTEKLAIEEQLRKSDTLTVVGELAAGIAHEIRNPLTALKGFVQLLEDSVQEDFSMYFNVITTELSRIDSIINEFLILAKPQDVKFVEYNVSKILKETVDLLSAQAVLHDVQFKTSYENNNRFIYCEPNQLKKVFINMIKNAIEVMPKGGFVTISTSVTKGHKLHIAIKDEGNGIPEDKLKRLGEPFYTTKERGTGLGLMVSYKIVEEHQGFIEVESQINEGTIFHIYLPLTHPEGARQS